MGFLDLARAHALNLAPMEARSTAPNERNEIRPTTCPIGDKRGYEINERNEIRASGCCPGCGRPLRTPETRTAGRCLRCMDGGDYWVAIQRMGARHRAAKTGRAAAGALS